MPALLGEGINLGSSFDFSGVTRAVYIFFLGSFNLFTCGEVSGLVEDEGLDIQAPSCFCLGVVH